MGPEYGLERMTDDMLSRIEKEIDRRPGSKTIKDRGDKNAQPNNFMRKSTKIW